MTDENTDRKPLHSFNTLLEKCFEEVDARYHARPFRPLSHRLPGFDSLDALLGGLQPGSLALVTGLPDSAKTALCVNTIANILTRQSKTSLNTDTAPEGSIAFVSTTLSKEQIAFRLLGVEARIDSARLHSGSLREEDWDRMAKGIFYLWDKNLCVIDHSRMTVSDIESLCREQKTESGAYIVLVDSLEQIAQEGIADKFSDIGDTVRNLKAMAQELQVAVVATYTIPDDIAEACKYSTLYYLPAIKAYVDTVLRMDRTCEPTSEGREELKVIVARQAEGEIGTVALEFDPRTGRIEENER